MISSELPEVLGMSDRVLVMREGRLVAEFDRARRDFRGRGRGDDGRDIERGAGGVTATAIASFGELPKRPVSPPGWPGASARGRDRRACGRCRLHQSALPRHAQSFRHPARQRLYRDRRRRHVDGHHLRQHRYFRRRAHRRAGDDQRLARRRGRADHRDLARAARHWRRQ